MSNSSGIHGAVRAFLQQQSILDVAGAPKIQAPGQVTKAGVVPFLREEPRLYYVMKPRGDRPELGDPGYQICKGTRQRYAPLVGWRDMREDETAGADAESLIETALREGIEELGIRLENIARLYDVGCHGFSSATTGKPKYMWLFAAEVIAEDDMLHDREVALTTSERLWMPADEFQESGRPDHRAILMTIENLLPKP